MENKVLTLDQAIKKGFYVYEFINGDFKYTDGNYIEHLIRDGKEIATGSYTYSYINGDYMYEEKSGNLFVKNSKHEIIKEEVNNE